MRTRKLTKTKYLTALKELHKTLSYTRRVSMPDFCKAHGLNVNTPVHLKRGGIIKNHGGRGKNAAYTWETIEPNIKMAQEVIDRLAAQKRTKKVPVLETKQAKPEQLKFKIETKENPKKISYQIVLAYHITSYFFGLIKIKTTYHYKSIKNEVEKT